MRLKKLCTALSLAALLATPSLGLANTTAGDGETLTPPGEKAITQRVVLTLGSNEALLNDLPYQLEVPPEVVDGTTFLPVRFVAEKVLGVAVQWDSTTKEIELARDDVKVKLALETGQALVNDQEVELTSPPFVKEGRTLVPLRFLAENLDMQIHYNSEEKTITIIKTEEMPEPVNLPPVITSLGLQKGVLKIGEIPSYQYTYENEPGENIVAEEWSCQFTGDGRTMTGKPRAFFQPGQYILSLRIQDAAGKWSETSTTRFTVSDEILVSEMEFKFSHPVYGELYENIEDINFNHLRANNDTTFERTGPVLHMSNSPEVVTRPGILYQSEASGDFRFFYHHLNGSTERQYLYVIAENNGTEPVTLKTLKSGVGGPTTDYMNLGQTVAMRYMSSSSSSSVTIKPGEKIILNQGLRHLNKGEAVTGMQDYKADGTIIISVVMGPEKAPEPEPEPAQEHETEQPPAHTGTQDDSTTTTGDNQKKTPAVKEDNAVVTIQVNNSNNSTETSAEPAPDAVAKPGGNSALETGPGTGSEPDPAPDAGDTDEPAEKPVPVKTPEQILREKIDYLLSLPALPRHPQQIRGVFPDADCLVNIRANKGNMEKITLGKEDPGFDSWVEGLDPLTGETVKSFGNYGVVYRVAISSPGKTGVLLNPRGSVFKGAFQGFDGNVYKAPATNHFTGLKKAAVLGVLQAGQKAEFLYTPPSGSDTPLVIALIPEEFWANPAD
ncbi:copper amine oxidase N-terminal domain-containing protein [Desulfallas thermosapovorans]|uniref:Copper amine oxidase-like protein n=1 Tax=Desulfallas thermosapovorans DSM 6562 TaxID=1121431 RepID=A0A5S4ZP54_9FIRM|nr:copper amine oxidase N-terminal domain-containing protein [Desulfallas thermosapovorans]TYO93933.1 copper amine oxidase-like protein [Desulfallas thermosapovorans DSM 6562]